MQRLAVQVLCRQLDQAWTYFSRSWRMQDHVYVQHLELSAFQSRFRDLTAALAELEKATAAAGASLPSSVSGAEVDAALDSVDACQQALQVEQARTRELAR